jgi:tetratricopeptide (TPR) repeat protein
MIKMIIILLFFGSSLLLFAENLSVEADYFSSIEKNKLEKNIAYSNKLSRHGKIQDDFKFCVQLINAMIAKYGENDIHTQIAYLVLARHYISSYMPEPANELLSFAEEIKENKSYEDLDMLNRLFYILKAELEYIKRNYNNAYLFFQKALMLSDDKNNEDIIEKIYILNRLIRVDTQLKKFKEAEEYGKRAMGLHKRISKSKENLDERINTFRSYADIYSNQNKYSFAIATLNVAIKIYSETETLNTEQMIYLFSDYAIYSLVLKNWEDAIYNAKKSMEIQKELKIEDNLISVNNLRLIGLSMQNKNKKNNANLYFEKALNILQKIEIPSFMKNEIKQSIVKDMIKN